MAVTGWRLNCGASLNDPKTAPLWRVGVLCSCDRYGFATGLLWVCYGGATGCSGARMISHHFWLCAGAITGTSQP
jgi:hypothetical protein